jgi:RNA polymerase sigma-70 factor (ECF subfamily)
MPDLSPRPEADLRLQLLVLRCQAGDERAFGQLYEEYNGRTLRYLRGLVRDDAEDVQQEVWLSVYRSIATLAKPSAFRTWLFSTTRRRAIDHLRQRRREQELIADTETASGVDDIADESALEALTAGAIEDSLAGLPPPQREVLLLRFQDDMSYSEIAVIVGCPVGTVKTRIHHAKRKLHDLLERG